MGSCSCSDTSPTPSERPIVIYFVAFSQTGKNKDAKNECPPIDPNFYCRDRSCDIKLLRSQILVDFSAAQIPVWLPWTIADCPDIKSKEKVKYDFSLCEYASPYIKDLKITINGKVDIYDDFQYIFRTTQPLKVIDGDYGRGGGITVGFGGLGGIIDPKTGNTLTTLAAIDTSKEYNQVLSVGYIECELGIKTIKGEITLSDGGKSYVRVYRRIDKDPCKEGYVYDSTRGYNEGGQYTVKAPFEADIKKLLTGETGGSFIYPLLIDFEYSGFTIPDDTYTVTASYSLDFKGTPAGVPDCQNMNSCKAQSIADTIYEDFKVQDSLSYTVSRINGLEVKCEPCGEFYCDIKRIESPIMSKKLPAPSPKVSALVLEVGQKVWGRCWKGSRKISIPVVPLQSTAIFGKNYTGRPRDKYLTYFGVIGHCSDEYLYGDKKNISPGINSKDICENINNNTVDLPCSEDLDFFGILRESYINPTYKAVKYIDCNSIVFGILDDKSITVGYEVQIPDNSIGIFYSVGGWVFSNYNNDIWHTKDCNGGWYYLSQYMQNDTCDWTQSSREWYKDGYVYINVGVATQANYSPNFDPNTECIYDSYYVDSGGKRVNYNGVGVDNGATRYIYTETITGNIS